LYREGHFVLLAGGAATAAFFGSSLSANSSAVAFKDGRPKVLPPSRWSGLRLLSTC